MLHGHSERRLMPPTVLEPAGTSGQRGHEQKTFTRVPRWRVGLVYHKAWRANSLRNPHYEARGFRTR